MSSTQIWGGILAATALLVFSAPAAPEALAQDTWQSLFDGKSLGPWKVVEFGGDGKVSVANGILRMEEGVMLTGVTWAGADLPKTNYEISLEAQKISGSDFFCGLTFPVADSHCSFIVGGWGGNVVGLSSIDDRDASENETTQGMNFASNRWYRIRVRVTKSKIQAWIDQEQLVDADITGKKITIRPEVDLSRPLGIAAWQTGAEVRDIKLRRLP